VGPAPEVVAHGFLRCVQLVSVGKQPDGHAQFFSKKQVVQLHRVVGDIADDPHGCKIESPGIQVLPVGTARGRGAAVLCTGIGGSLFEDTHLLYNQINMYQLERTASYFESRMSLMVHPAPRIRMEPVAKSANKCASPAVDSNIEVLDSGNCDKE